MISAYLILIVFHFLQKENMHTLTPRHTHTCARAHTQHGRLVYNPHTCQLWHASIPHTQLPPWECKLHLAEHPKCAHTD